MMHDDKREIIKAMLVQYMQLFNSGGWGIGWWFHHL